MKIIMVMFVVMSFQNFWSQSKVPNNYSNDTIVVIITLNNNELRGLLVEENFTTISLEVANEVKTYRKDDLKSYRYITRNQIKQNNSHIIFNLDNKKLHNSLCKS